MTDERKPYPLCKDCQHYLLGQFCNRERDLIEGEPVTCHYMRSPMGGCQVPGYMFEPLGVTVPADADITPDMKPGAIIRHCRNCTTPSNCYRAGGCEIQRALNK